MDPSAETLPSDEPPHHSAFESLLRQVARSPEADTALPGAELAPGVVVAGRFEVLEEIGRGGFAKVYRARDRVLSRDVAIKLLARRRRLSDRDLELFYREAQATARLNHVNIVTAYDWGEWNGAPFLILELLEGEPLSAVLARGPVSEERAWAIARDVARAVAYAHSQGVLHLDLKSQNVFVLQDGRIKVLDFGLAGLEWDEDLPGGLARVAGGTPATMAPEQAESRDTDARTDVWAIGIILHELLVGRVPKISPDAPSVALPASISRRAENVLRRTLARDPAARFANAAALVASLDPPAPPRRRLTWVLAALAVVGGIAATIATVTRRDRAPSAPPAPPPPERHRQLTFSGDVFDAELAPDGDAFAYITSNRRELWVRRLDSDVPQRLLVGNALDGPRWFPDGRRIVVMEENPLGHRIVSADGGEPLAISGLRQLTAVLPNGDSLASVWRGYASQPDLLVHPLSGDMPSRSPLPPSAILIADIDVAPDGRILLSTYDRKSDLWSIRPGSPGEALYSETSNIWGARWASGGEGIYFVSGDGRDAVLRWLAARPPRAAPTAVVSGLGLGPRLSVSRDGRRVLYHRAESFSNLSRLARGGTMVPITQGTALVSQASVSPDGRRMVYAVREDRAHSLVVGDVDPASPRTRLVRCAQACTSPVWSPDGSQIAYVRDELAGRRIAVVRSDGSGDQGFASSRPTNEAWTSLDWLSPVEIVYTPENNGPLRVLDLTRGTDRPFLASPAKGWMFRATVSGDGRVAFYWNRGTPKTRGVYIADRSGTLTGTFIAGHRRPIGWLDQGRRLLVTVDDYVGEDTWIVAIDRADSTTGTTSTIWETATRTVAEASTIPGTDEILLLHRGARSDAWLVEDPLGPPVP